MTARLIDDPPHHRDAIRAAVERQRRLMPAFRRQAPHAFGIDVGRIGDDEVVALALTGANRSPCSSRTRFFMRCSATFFRATASASLDKLDSIDLRFRKAHRREDRETSRAGAEIEHGLTASWTRTSELSNSSLSRISPI